MALTTTDLMKKRYKVIAEDTSRNFEVGDILTPFDKIAGFENIWVTNHHLQNSRHNMISAPEKYPHLFKDLQWWEDRKPEEMPEYVKDVFRPGMVNDNYVYKVKGHFTRDCTSIGSGIKQDAKYWVDENDFSHIYVHYEPATESEYLEYIQSKSIK